MPKDSKSEYKTTKLFDVEAVNIQTGERRKLAEKKSKDNAAAIIYMAVMRRGLDEEFFTAVPHVEN